MLALQRIFSRPELPPVLRKFTKKKPWGSFLRTEYGESIFVTCVLMQSVDTIYLYQTWVEPHAFQLPLDWFTKERLKKKKKKNTHTHTHARNFDRISDIRKRNVTTLKLPYWLWNASECESYDRHCQNILLILVCPLTGPLLDNLLDVREIPGPQITDLAVHLCGKV